MKTALIVPLHNQYKNIDRLIDGIKSQLVKPDKVLFVIDRFSPEDTDDVRVLGDKCASINNCSIHFAEEYLGKLKRKNEGFFAPHIRNTGLACISSEYECIVMIDGDCIPQESLIKSHMEACKKANGHPVLNVGRRREEKYGWKDQREIDRNLIILNIFRDKDYIVSNPFLIGNSAIVWSCNISLNSAALNRLSEFNQRIYGRREIFNSDFNGEWGGEDGFLGICASRCMIPIQMLSNIDSGIMHIDHPRSSLHDNNSHMKYMDRKIIELNELLIKKPLDIGLFL